MSGANEKFSQQMGAEMSAANQKVIYVPQWVDHKSQETNSNVGESGHEEKSGAEGPYKKEVAEANQLIGKVSLKELEKRFPTLWKPTYKSWSNAKYRAKESAIPFSPDFDAFEGFLRVMGFRSFPSASLDRKDNGKGYSPDNCHWATKEQQSQNRHCTVMLTPNGETKPLVVWARKTGQRPDTLRKRRAAGWSHEEVITGRRRRSTHGDEFPWPAELHSRLESLYRRGHAPGESRVDFYFRMTGDALKRLQAACIEAYDQYGEVPADLTERYRRAELLHLEARQSWKGGHQ